MRFADGNSLLTTLDESNCGLRRLWRSIIKPMRHRHDGLHPLKMNNIRSDRPEEDMRFLLKTADIIFENGRLPRILGERFYPVRDNDPVLDNLRSRLTRSLYSRVALFKEDMISRRLS